MDIDRARAQGLCFKCGKRGHISRDCPDNRRGPAQARAFVQELDDKETEILAREISQRQDPSKENAEGFQNVQE